MATRLVLGLLVGAAALTTETAQAQRTDRAVTSANIQKLADAVLSVMSYTVAPDVTTGSLSLSNTGTGNPSLSITQFGGGFTWSKSTPLYLEGNAAFSRYDPVFVATDGTETRSVPTKWNGVSATGGIGWDFPLSEHWVIRPILNFTIGTIASDLSVAKFWISNNTNLDLDFLDGGRLKARGLGGSLMLDYEEFAPERDLDLEIRYTNVPLYSYGGHTGVKGHAAAQNVSVWSRMRIPTGWGMVWDRPVRYVLEGAYTDYVGTQGETGLERMASVGVGLELDSSAKDIFVSRMRALVRYKFGPHVQGWSLGLAVSF